MNSISTDNCILRLGVYCNTQINIFKIITLDNKGILRGICIGTTNIDPFNIIP